MTIRETPNKIRKFCFWVLKISAVPVMATTQGIDNLELLDQLPAFLPATITRAETALSKYPVHNLSKTDSIEIHIHRKGEVGDADIQWAVSPSREYGEPRQLAYKVDTLIVNRRIDEAGRPIPRIIRLGSLRDVCHDLGLSPGGDNFSGLRLALLQNASAFITAKLTYRGADGGTKKFEAGFTRYSVVFTGDEMPNGYRADAVHILLNEHYWKLLNKAQFRPLDYDYQKVLKPAAHRFYELVSFPIYGCLSRSQPVAKLLYSDYCLRAPQERYFDRARVQKQMYKIHKPHLDSEYIAEICYRKTLDADGAPDWEICYVPGRRAKAHFAFFRRTVSDTSATLDVSACEVTSLAGVKSKRSKMKRAIDPAAPALAALQERGISFAKAVELTKGREHDPVLIDSLEWGDHLIRQASPGTFRNPAGFYVYLVRESIKPPRDFETSRKRAAREAEQAQEQERRIDRLTLEQAYEEYLESETAKYIHDRISDGELAHATAQKKECLRLQFKNMSPDQIDDLACRAALTEIRRSVPVMQFDEFCRRPSETEVALRSSSQQLF
jgi:hypothetical protein